MQLRIISLALVQVFGLLFSCTLSATRAKPVPSSSQVVQKFTEAELTERFNSILDKELSGGDVCVTLPAARQLEDLMRKAAGEIVHKKDFRRVPEAERNIRVFAHGLLSARIFFTDSGAKIVERITPDTVAGVLRHRPDKAVSENAGFSFRGLCPLFPICK